VIAPLPPPAELKISLRIATERLAQEARTASLQPPALTEFEWGLARAAATIHGVSGLLAAQDQWVGAALWRDFVTSQRREIATQQHRFQELLGAIDDRARSMGIAIFALKGAALHARRVFQAGDRPMADLDLLVREADIPAMLPMLAGLGMRSTGASWKHRMFQEDADVPVDRFGEDARRPLNMDLHTRVAERLSTRVIDLTDEVLIERHPGVHFYDSEMTMLRHLLLHAAGNISGRWLRLIQLVEIARVLERVDSRGWDELVRPAKGGTTPWWMFAPLVLVGRYFPGTVATDRLEHLGLAAPRLLRASMRGCTLSEVSASDPFLKALPALPWCQSLGDRLRYVADRVFPSSEEVHGFQQLANTRSYAANDSWVRRSQAGRVVRWLWARPPRAATMHAVRGGLESEHSARVGASTTR
jgi:hypothetical protein